MDRVWKLRPRIKGVTRKALFVAFSKGAVCCSSSREIPNLATSSCRHRWRRLFLKFLYYVPPATARFSTKSLGRAGQGLPTCPRENRCPLNKCCCRYSINLLLAGCFGYSSIDNLLCKIHSRIERRENAHTQTRTLVTYKIKEELLLIFINILGILKVRTLLIYKGITVSFAYMVSLAYIYIYISEA